MSFLQFLFGRNKQSASVAKQRLQLVLAAERAPRGTRRPDYLPALQRELLGVVSKYVKVQAKPAARSAVIKKDGYKSVTRSIPANNSSLIVVTLDPVEAEGDPKPDLKEPGQ